MHHPHSQSERESVYERGKARVGLHHSSSFICPLWPNVISFHFSYRRRRRRPNFGMGAIRRTGGTKRIRERRAPKALLSTTLTLSSSHPKLRRKAVRAPKKTYCIIGEEKCRVLIPASPFCQRYGIISLQLCGKRQVAC